MSPDIMRLLMRAQCVHPALPPIDVPGLNPVTLRPEPLPQITPPTEKPADAEPRS